MSTQSVVNLISKWFQDHTPLLRRANQTTVQSRMGYAGTYPKVQRNRWQHSNVFSCIPLRKKFKKNTETTQFGYKKLEVNRSHPSIKGCTSFARFGIYDEGSSDDDC